MAGLGSIFVTLIYLLQRFDHRVVAHMLPAHDVIGHPKAIFRLTFVNSFQRFHARTVKVLNCS
jgi:hypothetical protein